MIVKCISNVLNGPDPVYPGSGPGQYERFEIGSDYFVYGIEGINFDANNFQELTYWLKVDDNLLALAPSRLFEVVDSKISFYWNYFPDANLKYYDLLPDMLKNNIYLIEDLEDSDNLAIEMFKKLEKQIENENN